MPYLTFNVPESPAESSSKLSSGNSRAETRSNTVEMSGTTFSAMGVAADGSRMTEYPLVKLDTEIITDATAARLATSLLGHVLFLKNQVPL
jgi:hypothetical protein